MENLLDNKEAARFLGISEEKFAKLVDSKVIPTYLIAGQFLRFKEEELIAIKDILNEYIDFEDERAFHQAFTEVKGLARFKEILRANDVYIVLAVIILLILSFMFFK